MSDNFQIIAVVPKSVPNKAELADKIGQVFGVELGGLLNALSDTGVCVETASSLNNARNLGLKLTSIGANYIILDLDGEEVDRGNASSVGRTAKKENAKTMMGGFMPPPGGKMPPGAVFPPPKNTIQKPLSKPVPPSSNAPLPHHAQGGVSINAAPEEKLELEDGGFAAPNSTIAQGAVDLGHAAEKLQSTDIQREAAGGFAHKHSTIDRGGIELDQSGDDKMEMFEPGGFSLDALNSESLVMLDGTSETLAVKAAPEREEIDNSDFLPPQSARDHEELELAPPPPPPPPQEEPSDGLAPLLNPDEMEQSNIASPTEIASVQLKKISASELNKKNSAPAPIVDLSGPLLLHGRLRSEFPRIRIVAGFFVALLIASIFPIFHASSVRNNQIEALRVDLSTAITYGDALASTPGYQTPDQIRSVISSLQTKHAATTIIVWSLLTGIFLFLWLRFT